MRESDKPMERAVFSFVFKRASAKGRHGNAFFVWESSNKPENWIECRLYYGGRRTLMITGGKVKSIEEKKEFEGKSSFTVR